MNSGNNFGNASSYTYTADGYSYSAPNDGQNGGATNPYAVNGSSGQYPTYTANTGEQPPTQTGWGVSWPNAIPQADAEAGAEQEDASVDPFALLAAAAYYPALDYSAYYSPQQGVAAAQPQLPAGPAAPQLPYPPLAQGPRTATPRPSTPVASASVPSGGRRSTSIVFHKPTTVVVKPIAYRTGQREGDGRK